MYPVLTSEQMRAADAACIASGTPASVLMDRAGYAVAVAAVAMLGRPYGRRVTVVCGKGSNGGDGRVAARYLTGFGADVRVVEPGSRLRRCDLVVDALLGTGTLGAPRGAVASAISAINELGRPVLSVDVPSGLGTGGEAVRAAVTLAVQALKPEHLLCGRVDVADIGIPTPNVTAWVPQAADVARVLPARTQDTHKYKVGAAALVAGGPGYSGAAVLAGLGAAGAGAGMVYEIVPPEVLGVVENALPEAVKLARDHFQMARERARAFAVGPGLGRSSESVDLVESLLDVGQVLVLDADGLWCLAQIGPTKLCSRTAPTILTPHAGEFSMLGGGGYGRLDAASEMARRLGAVVHLKGDRAVTATPDGTVFVNPTGTPLLATAGSGDVLTGVIVSLAAQGLGAAESAWAGAYVHGLAARLAGERRGAITAGQVAAALPLALDRVRRREPPGAVMATVFT